MSPAPVLLRVSSVSAWLPPSPKVIERPLKVSLPPWVRMLPLARLTVACSTKTSVPLESMNT